MYDISTPLGHRHSSASSCVRVKRKNEALPNSIEAANNNAIQLGGFGRKTGLSGQNLAGSGALVFEGELLETA